MSFQICITKKLVHDIGFAQRTSTCLVRRDLPSSKSEILTLATLYVTTTATYYAFLHLHLQTI